LLGNGSFGTVWKARVGSDLVAVKKIEIEKLSTSEKALLKLEAEIMQQLSHPRIISCLGVFESDDEYCMVLEFCPGGSVADLIAESPRMESFQILELVLDIAVGMEYLHKLNVVHRDLKPGNIVLDDCMRAKIVDFGLAVTKTSTMTSFRGESEAGTPAFMVI
jgi:serine/threonine protein kinase